MAIGCASSSTQRGVIMTGSRSTSERIISNDRLPEPSTMDARSSITAAPDSHSSSPTSCRLRRCGERSGPAPSPPR